MERSFYEEYFDLERKHWWFKARKNILRSHLKKVFGDRKDLSILNVGASTGHSSEMLGEFGEVTSFEYDGECIRYAKTRLDIDMVQGSVLALPFCDGQFDAVCAFDVIEHVHEDDMAVMEMLRVLARGGVLCVTVPAFMFLWSRHDEVNHHLRRYTKTALLRLFSGPGSFVYHSYFNSILFCPVALYRLLKRLVGERDITEVQGSGSDFSFQAGKGEMGDRFLYLLFNSESWVVAHFLKLPFGVSILATWRKGNEYESIS